MHTHIYILTCYDTCHYYDYYGRQFRTDSSGTHRTVRTTGARHNTRKATQRGPKMSTYSRTQRIAGHAHNTRRRTTPNTESERARAQADQFDDDQLHKAAQAYERTMHKAERCRMRFRTFRSYHLSCASERKWSKDSACQRNDFALFTSRLKRH